MGLRPAGAEGAGAPESTTPRQSGPGGLLRGALTLRPVRSGLFATMGRTPGQERRPPLGRQATPAPTVPAAESQPMSRRPSSPDRQWPCVQPSQARPPSLGKNVCGHSVPEGSICCLPLHPEQRSRLTWLTQYCRKLEFLPFSYSHSPFLLLSLRDRRKELGAGGGGN